MIFTIIINSCDHGTNSYAEFQLGLQNRNNTPVLIIFATCTATMYYPCHLSAAPHLKINFPQRTNPVPPIQFNRIAPAARRVISPRGSGIKRIPNTSRIGSCSGYPATPYLPRPDVRSRRQVAETALKIEPVCTPDRSSRSRRPLWPSP
jgi:hypothetical protein